MRISLHTILYYLECPEKILSPHLQTENWFSDVRLLEPGMKGHSSDVLYVAKTEQAAAYLKHGQPGDEELYMVCVAESEDKPMQLPPQVKWLFVPEIYDIISVYNRIYGLFFRLRTWDKKMDQIILMGQDMSIMLEAYTELLPNHLLMWDASFNICAYTKSIPAPGEEITAMEEKGYFSPEIVEFLIKKNLVAKSVDTVTRRFSGDMLPSGRSALIHHYFRQGLRFYSVCAYLGQDQPCEQGILDLMEYFFERLNLYLDKNAPVFREQHFLYESFLTGLLDGKMMDSKVIEEKARMFHIRYNGVYHLYCLQINDYKTTLARYLIETVASSAPDVKFLQYDHMILMLKSQDKKMCLSEEKRQNWLDRITRLLVTHNAHCGVSSTFHHLRELRTAYVQASMALKFGLLFHPEEQSKIYFYKDYFIYHMFHNVRDEMELQGLYLKRFHLLLEDDLKKHTNNLQLLSVYLENNQAVTATARQMFMHRNSVIYRIRKIEDLLGVNLEIHRDVFRVDFSLQLLHYLFWTNKKYEKYRDLLPEFQPEQKESRP